MKIDRLLALGLLTGITLVSFELAVNQTAQAKPIPLPNLECLKVSGPSGYRAGIDSHKEDIILNKEIYTSLMRAASTHDFEVACKLPSAKSANLDLELTLPSSAGGPTIINFYLNGTQIVSEKVFPGKITLINEKLTGRADISYQVGGRRTFGIETICASGSGCDQIRFLKGNLNVVSNPGAKE
jgi:hypothetical protein